MLNKVTLMGRITKDLELKTTSNKGVAVVSFSIATDRNYKENGEFQTDFFDCVAWRKTAEFICKYFGKGQLIAIDGVLQTRKFTDNNGVERKVVEIIVDGAHFCGSKKPENGGGQNNTPNGNHGQPGVNYGGQNSGNYGGQPNGGYPPQYDDGEFGNTSMPTGFVPDFSSQ